MSERKRCIRCDRLIDEWSAICPFCNWDQSQPVRSKPVAAPVPAPEPGFLQNRANRFVVLAGSFVALVIISFGLGSLFHGKDAPKNAPLPVKEKTDSRPIPRSDVPLVPMNEPGGIAEAPITSAPAPNIAVGVPNEYQRADATAVSSAEYTQLAARVRAEKKLALTDPRTLTGPAYAQAPQRRVVDPMPPSQISSSESHPAISIRTKPVPQYQPIPDVHVDRNTTARLDLVIGADGKVKDINVRDAIPGQTAQLIAAVQSWRFRPATENGIPVAAPFSVDISFRAND
ncbi:MAG TPA: energy transducer TonB [Thermoanaerobaculia bacterium]|nr:energy transducer TonB [Thermoanaerobaculia bacterium]